jgi:hypothetical protein
MADQSRSQDRARERERPRDREEERPRERKASEEAPPKADTRETFRPVEQPLTGGKAATGPGFKAEPQKVSLGQAATRTLGIEWIPAPVPWPQGGTARSVRFKVTTSAGAAIEARLEQLAYNRTESGQGSLMTQIVPAAPIGTRGKLTVRDPATGETVEQPWVWVNLGGGGWSLWAFIKGLIWPGK